MKVYIPICRRRGTNYFQKSARQIAECKRSFKSKSQKVIVFYKTVLRLTPSSLAGSVEETDISKTTVSDLKETEIPSSKNNVCSKFNDCPSECCIDGQCVESSRCKPVFVARGGRGGGGRSRGRSRGRGGGYSGGTSSGSGGSLPVWGIILIVFGSILVAFSPFIIAWICSSCS